MTKVVRRICVLFTGPATLVALLGLVGGGIPLFSISGCGSGDNGGLSPVQKQISEVNTSFERYQKAMAEVAEIAAKMEAKVTDDGTYDLYGSPGRQMDQIELDMHAILLDQWATAYRSAFLASYDMVQAARAMELEQQTSALWFDLPGSELEQQRQNELFTLTGMALLAAGVSLSTWLACKKTEESKTKACQDIKNIILATQNQLCLDAYAGELKMSKTSGVTKEEILAHIENHPGRASFCTKAAFSMQVLVDSGELAGTNCQAPSAADMTETRYTVTQDVVETGANYSVSMLTTVTSTPTSLIVQSAKVSEGAKTATELGIALTETAMQEYGSTLPEEVTVTGVSDETSTVSIPPSTSTNTPSEAVSVVADDQAFADVLNEAFDDLAVDVANSADIPLTTTGVDGSQSLDVPNSIFVGNYPIAGLQSTVTLPIPNIGFSTVVVLSPETVPEVNANVDTSQNNAIDFSGIDISQWGEEPKDSNSKPPAGGDGLTVLAPPGPHIAGMDVLMTVDCPEDTAMPATMDSNTLSGVSLAWGSVNACPVTVIFNADAAGSYTINLTLTDSGGKSYQGTVTLTVVDAYIGECMEEEHSACYNAIDEDYSCWDSCPPEDVGRRAHEACKWYCSAAKAYALSQCGYQHGCVSKYTEKDACTAKCNFAYSACLEAVESDDLDYLGNCPADQGGCLGPCMSML
jgi:hypothetical protein